MYDRIPLQGRIGTPVLLYLNNGLEIILIATRAGFLVAMRINDHRKYGEIRSFYCLGDASLRTSNSR